MGGDGSLQGVSSPTKESGWESPQKGGSMLMTELIHRLVAWEEQEQRHDEKMVQALNAMEEKQATFAAELEQESVGNQKLLCRSGPTMQV